MTNIINTSKKYIKSTPNHKQVVFKNHMKILYTLSLIF